MDAVSAYLAVRLHKEIYMKVPESYNTGKAKFVRLLRGLYGLKQSARLWNKLLVDFLKTLGFVQSLYDPCLMLRDGMAITIYVDDLLFFAANIKEIEEVKQAIKDRFKIKDLREAKTYLSINITYIKTTLKIN